MEKVVKFRTGTCAALVVLSFVIAAGAGAATSSAYATIDWSTLDITIIGEGGLVSLDDTVVANAAWVADEHGTGLSASEQLFAPAYAAHPFYEDNGAVAAFDEDAGSAIAGADFGSASAESVASTNFFAVGWGTALLSVAYSVAAEIENFWTPSAVAGATTALGLTRIDLGDGSEEILFYDEASALRVGGAGASADTGYLTALFDFDEAAPALFRLDGSASALAVGALAAPVPAALPLMLSALGIAGTVARRKPAR